MADSLATPPIVVENLYKRWPRRSRWFGRKPGVATSDVLCDINLSVAAGEIFAILGENGAGKTTLLKLIAGLARPNAGRIVLFGIGEPGSSPALRGRVSYAGGERGFYFRLTARENLQFFGALDGFSRRDLEPRIEAAAAALDIGAFLDRRFAELSSGIRQRLSVARALLPNPDILLLDEPTRALDPVHADGLRRFVRETLVEQLNKTVVLATNLFEEADALAHRAVVLRGGVLHPMALERRPGYGVRAADAFGITTGV